MNMKYVAGGAFLFNTLLYGSYYAISKEVLGRVDPIVFSFCEMMTLTPPALLILFISRRYLTRQALKSGFLLGSCLCMGLFMLAIALRYNSATGTAFFPALNGLLAVLFTWIFLRQPIARTTWFAGIISVTGTVLLMANADMGGPRGSLIAFLGGLFCTLYIFLADHEQKNHTAYWPLFAVELLTMALWANLIALLFGNWNAVQFQWPKDTFVISYIGLGTVLLPIFITVSLQKYISPVTVSFISILEPILGAIVANLYLHEMLPLDGYIGGGLIVAGVLIHTCGSLKRPTGQLLLQLHLGQIIEHLQTSPAMTLLYPLICSGIGAYIVSRLGGFPPPVWHDLIATFPQFPALMQQGETTQVVLLIAQSLSWFVAWCSLLLMGGAATYRTLEKLFITSSHQSTFNPTWKQNPIVGTELALSASTFVQPSASEKGNHEISLLIDDLPTAPWPALSYHPQQKRRRVPAVTSPALLFPLSLHKEQEVITEATPAPFIQTQRLPTTTDLSSYALQQIPKTFPGTINQQTPYTNDLVEQQQRRSQHRIRLAHAESPRATDGITTLQFEHLEELQL